MSRLCTTADLERKVVGLCCQGGKDVVAVAGNGCRKYSKSESETPVLSMCWVVHLVWRITVKMLQVGH